MHDGSNPVASMYNMLPKTYTQPMEHRLLIKGVCVRKSR